MLRPRHAVLLAAVLAAAALALPARAQHADFVLFGEPNAAAANVAEQERAVHPITAPFYAEDSFVTSDLRAWFIYHDFPRSSAIGGGTAKAVALQVRLALTDRLQLVAYKDGYIDFDTGAVDAGGLFDIAAGLKYNLIQDWDSGFHLSVGAGYEFKTGNGDVLQNDSELRLWASANQSFDRLHLGGTFNYFFGVDKDRGLGSSDHLSWHLHADYWVCEWFSPVVELNGYHVTDEGAVTLPFQGVDVANLGGVESEDVVTIGFGGEFRGLIDRLAARVAYEMPLTDGEQLFGYRWTASLVYSF